MNKAKDKPDLNVASCIFWHRRISVGNLNLAGEWIIYITDVF